MTYRTAVAVAAQVVQLVTGPQELHQLIPVMVAQVEILGEAQVAQVVQAG